ncbi:pRiA4b ORF-3-like protein [Lutimaribacter pacificus]|uniref:PRiA4b ORF-3-like protein n=1 Tax=Lutimaribacter pacificus TaxID=391948 RepID=A0A1H0PDI3_9RHOB|nr:plasmid pRiA4b ORF-3 family protein [Lutimaribacter pacificus]SDP02810.1 pRiA4b ORF-3-like protein [Lutimaribacter pacificus]SHL05364.1 pRiA4b ORF-3-like protein [Lutimaribacter pacificus]
MYQPANAVRLHVSLAEIDPPIWRRLVVPSDWTLDRLHLVLQAAFSWTDSHLHEFRIGGLRYGDPDQLEDGFGGPQIFDYTGVRLADFTGQDLTFNYLYDFGDDWTHVIRIEEWLSLDPLPRHAECTEGARARPPEDVGGPWSYADFLETTRDPNHEDHSSNLRWAGGHFDPDWFDKELINKDLRNTFRKNTSRRLHQPKPKPSGR